MGQLDKALIDVGTQDAVAKCYQIAQSVQDSEWIMEVRPVEDTYAAGYTAAADEIKRRIQAAFPNVNVYS